MLCNVSLIFIFALIKKSYLYKQETGEYNLLIIKKKKEKKTAYDDNYNGTMNSEPFCGV